MTIRQVLKWLIGAEPPRQVPDLGRNQICWCGSGKKYKRCHQASDDRRRAASRASSSASSGLGF